MMKKEQLIIHHSAFIIPVGATMRQKHMFFDAEEYWRDKKYKCWVVCLSSRKGKVKPSTSGRRKEYRAYYNVQARTAERAIEVAKRHCTVLSGRIEGTARLAMPRDLGAC